MQFKMGLVTILLAALSAAVNAEDTYTLSMLPCYSLDEINRRVNPLADYLADKIGAKINVIITNDYSQHEKRINSGLIEMGYENPYVYAMVSKTHQALVMEVRQKNRNKFRGIIITRKDKAIRELKDLLHKKICIVGHTSAGGFLSQKLSLMDAGIDVEKECTLIEATENKQENVIFSVYAGDADAGFIRESALNHIDKYIVPDKIAVISRCKWLPNWTFSIKRTLPETFKQKVQTALLDLKSDHPAIKALRIQKFKKAVEKDYEIVKRAVIPPP